MQRLRPLHAVPVLRVPLRFANEIRCSGSAHWVQLGFPGADEWLGAAPKYISGQPRRQSRGRRWHCISVGLPSGRDTRDFLRWFPPANLHRGLERATRDRTTSDSARL